MSRTSRPVLGVVVLGGLLALGSGAPGCKGQEGAGSGATGLQQLGGHVTRAIAAAPIVARVSSDTQLELLVGLRMRDPVALRDAVRSVSDPKSPSFRHYVNPAEFGERFGASEADYEAALEWARASHFVVSPSANRLVVNLVGSVGDIETALHVHINYATRPDGTRFRAPDREPSLALSVPVAHISNLDDYVVPKRDFLHCDGEEPADTPTGSDVRTAYLGQVPQQNTLYGQNLTVGIVHDFDGCFYQSDLDTFVTGLHLPSGVTALPVESVDAKLPCVTSGTMWNCPAGVDADEETSIDVQMVTAMAPAAQIQLVHGVLPSILSYFAGHPEISQISSSTSGYTVDANEKLLLAQMAMQGQSLFLSSGDYGAYAGAGTYAFDEMENKVDQQDYAVTIVGGTKLTMASDPNGTTIYGSERGWDGSGGGVLDDDGPGEAPVPIAPYQKAYLAAYFGDNPLNYGVQNQYANVPDVSTSAAGTDVVMSKVTDAGVLQQHCAAIGTSTATPLWTGFMALVNEAASQKGDPPVGFANPALYDLAANASQPVFHDDITTGQTPTEDCQGYYFTDTLGGPCRVYKLPNRPPLQPPDTCACNAAGPNAGYNLVTGLGTPTGALITALAGMPCGSNSPCGAPGPIPSGEADLPAAYERPPLAPCSPADVVDFTSCVCVPKTCPCGTGSSSGHPICKPCEPSQP